MTTTIQVPRFSRVWALITLAVIVTGVMLALVLVVPDSADVESGSPDPPPSSPSAAAHRFPPGRDFGTDVLPAFAGAVPSCPGRCFGTDLLAADHATVESGKRVACPGRCFGTDLLAADHATVESVVAP